MREDFIVDELVKYGSECMRVFGRKPGALYVSRCLPLWEAQFGEAVAKKARERLAKNYREQCGER